MANILDKIVARKREEVVETKAQFPVNKLEKLDLFKREPLLLTKFLRDESRTGIIAEFKRKSPSKGIINDKVSVEEVVKGYEAAGASAISVLTDRDFFMGQNHDLIAARAAVQVPVLRKDFMINEYQIIEAKAIGADIILLIAAVLSPDEIARLGALAKLLGLSVLLEVHNLDELQRSLHSSVDVVGVNNRNLNDFSVSVDTSFELAKHIPDEFLKISESAISDPKIIKQLKAAGFDGFLIGENFMKTEDPGKAMEGFVAAINKG